MSFAITARAPQLNPEVFAKPQIHEVPKFPPPPPDPTTITTKSGGLLESFNPQSLRQLADGWCGNEPRHLPFPLPPKSSDDGDWCGTVPHRFPFPPPPQPWLDLAASAQAFR